MRQAASTRPSALKALLLTLRPEQWTKNLLVFAGVMFGGRLLDFSAMWAAITTFAVFCSEMFSETAFCSSSRPTSW